MTLKEMYQKFSELHQRKMEISEQRNALIEQEKWGEAQKLQEDILKVMDQMNTLNEEIYKKEKEVGEA